MKITWTRFALEAEYEAFGFKRIIEDHDKQMQQVYAAGRESMKKDVADWVLRSWGSAMTVTETLRDMGKIK